MCMRSEELHVHEWKLSHQRCVDIMGYGDETREVVVKGSSSAGY